jgi:hypothetical protein
MKIGERNAEPDLTCFGRLGRGQCLIRLGQIVEGVALPVLDEWGYPRHLRGVTAYPGLYAVGLPWLYSEPSSVFAGVGADAAHVVEHLVARV